MIRRHLRSTAAILSLGAIAACSNANAEHAAQLAADSARAEGASKAEVTRRADAARAATPRVRTRTLASGTTIQLVAVTDVTSQKDAAGKTFTARTTSAYTVSGDTVIPAGAELIGQVTVLNSAGSQGGGGQLQVAFNTLRVAGQDYPIAVNVTSLGTRQVARGVTVDDAAKVAVGAAAGAIAGRIIGRNTTGAVAGAVVGGAAGTVYANQTKDHDIVLSPGSQVEVVLAGPFSRAIASR
jgi:hypothetical protein